MKNKEFPDDSDVMGISEKDQRERAGNEMDYSQGNYDSPSTDVLFPGYCDPSYPSGTFDEFH